MTTVSSVLILLGAVVILLGAVGLLRLPDVLSRINAATKAATLGVGALLVGAASLANDALTGIKLTVAAALLLITSPVAGHLIGRAAYRAGVPLWQRTMADDLARYVDDGRDRSAGG